MLSAMSLVVRKDNYVQRLIHLYFLLFFIGSSYLSCAQSCQAYDHLDDRTYLLSVGGGFHDFYAAQTGYNNSLKPASDRVLIKDYGAILLRLDKRIIDTRFDIGVTLYYSRQYFEFNTQHRYVKADTADYQDLGVGLRCNRYFVYNDKFHFYLGAGGGVRIPLRDKFFTPFYGEVVLGIRYFPLERLGIFAEIGASKVLGQAGISIKL
jgi:hypothetical protein